MKIIISDYQKRHNKIPEDELPIHTEIRYEFPDTKHKINIRIENGVIKVTKTGFGISDDTLNINPLSSNSIYIK